MSLSITVAEDRASISDGLAKRLAWVLHDAVQKRGAATLVVSGGTSPGPLFDTLARCRLAWDAVTVIPSDERVVALDHADRNEAMIRGRLAVDAAAGVRMLGLLPADVDADPDLTATERRLGALGGPLDAVVLGMGADGHTASLFPDDPEIDAALKSDARCVLARVPRLPAPRVSLTPRVLLDAREIHVLAFGDDKYETLERVRRPGPATEYPIRAVLHQDDVPVFIHWAP